MFGLTRNVKYCLLRAIFTVIDLNVLPSCFHHYITGVPDRKLLAFQTVKTIDISSVIAYVWQERSTLLE